MTIEELQKENEALKEENARLTYSVAELLKKVEEYKAASEVKAPNDIKNSHLNESSALVQKLMKKVLDLPLSMRSKNSLYAAGCETLGDVVKLNKVDLLKSNYCGKKTLMEINELVELAGLTWGMDVDGIIEADMKEYLQKKSTAKK